jgi:twinkle protein
MDDIDDPLWGAIDDTPAPIRAAPGTLHGIETVAKPDVIWWAPDIEALEAVRAAGYTQSVALVPDEMGDAFGLLGDYKDQTDAWQKIVICGGPDAFVGELARRLGRHRVWRVCWPDGCTDASDTLQRRGTQAVRDAIDAAEPFPIEGIHRPTKEAMLAHRHAAPPITLTTGCEASDKIMRFPGEGKLIIITGIPNHGKSSVLTHIMAHTASAHDRRWAVFSPEMGEWQILAAQIMAWRAAKPFRPVHGTPSMTDDDIREGAEWCRPRFAFLSFDAEDEAPTLEGILEKARVCVFRDGTTDLVIDPWNEVEHEDGRLNETTYTGRVLQRLRGFAARHGCNVWIVAHPRILRALKPGEPVPVPTAYDISGSSNFANKGDVILTVHCPEVKEGNKTRPGSVTQLHLLKARFRRWGRRGGVAELEFDPTTGRFRSAMIMDSLADDAPNTEPPPPAEYSGP